MQKDNWVWTDELVKEVVYWAGHSLISKEMAEDQVRRFKFIKTPTPKPQAEKGAMIKCIIEPGMIIEPQINAGWFKKGHQYKVRAVDIPSDQVLFEFPISCQLSALVNDIQDGKFKIIEPQAENKPDWEIVLYWNADGFHAPTEKCKPNGCIIKSVKRLSDGEIFSVGDDTNDGVVKGFHTWKNQMMVEFKDSPTGCECLDINYVKKLPPQPQKDKQEWQVGEEVMFEVFAPTVNKEKNILYKGRIKECLYFKNSAVVVYHDVYGSGRYESRELLFSQLKKINTKDKQERIEVRMSFNGGGKHGMSNHTFTVSKFPANGQMPLIKQAIESVLNDEHPVRMFDTNYVMVQKSDWEKRFTEKQLLDAEEKAFEAGRKQFQSTEYRFQVPMAANVYTTFSDYKNSQSK